MEEGWGIGVRKAVHSLKNPGSSSALEWLVITKQVIMRRDKDNIEMSGATLEVGGDQSEDFCGSLNKDCL